jgi:hypothetical protein
MIKRRGKSQIGNLTPNHKALESRGHMRFDSTIIFTLGKIFSRAIKYCIFILKTNLI